MNRLSASRTTSWNGLRVFALLLAALFVLVGSRLCAQSAPGDSEKPIGTKMSFDVASVKVDNLGLPPAGPKQSLKVTGGSFSMTNCGVFCLISFAYNLTADDLIDVYPQLPKGMISERFDVEARADGNPAQDGVRLMVQSLLADRFKLTMHYETREKPVYDLILAKPGKLGTQLRLYSRDEQACVNTATAQTVADGFPASCGYRQSLPASQAGYSRDGGREMGIAQISALFRVYGHLDRPIVDKTGLSDTYDYIIEWDPKASAGPEEHDSTGPSFIEALQDQLGLKLKASTASVKEFVIDHIEDPSPN